MNASLKVKFLNADFAVSGMMTPQLFAAIRTMGFASVIDVTQTVALETEDTAATDIARRARLAGMEYRKFADAALAGHHTDRAAELAQLLDEVPKPAVIYSRTGNRAMTLWTMAMQDVLAPHDIAMAASTEVIDFSEMIVEKAA